MSTVGPLARSRSKRTKPGEPDVGGHGGTVTSSGPTVNVKPLPLRADLGRKSHSDEIVIGLALGSPGQSPLPPLPPDDRDDVCQNFDVTYTSTSPEHLPSALGVITEINAGTQGIKRKNSKWKTFGSFFGRKDSANQSSEASSFYQLDRVNRQGPAKHHHAQDHPEMDVPRRKQVESSRTNQTSTDSPNSTTGQENSGLLRTSGSRKRSASSAGAGIEDQRRTPLPPPIVLRKPLASLLQVEIPNVELERYSVMFGDLLEFSQKPKQQPTIQSSLLARRQERNEELQAVPSPRDPHPSPVDGLQKRLHQRDDSTSSRSAKSPSFSLFPSSTSNLRQPTNNTECKPMSKPSPLSRSTTAPNGLAPPDRPQIHKSKSHDQDHVFVVIHSSVDSPSTPLSGRGRSLDVLCPSASSTQASLLECPEPSHDSHSAEEIDPPAPTTRSAREAFLKRAFPARKSSMKMLSLPLEEPMFPSLPRSGSVSTLAEVSIARQISISRRQRQLLVPIAPKLVRQPMRPSFVNGVSTPAARKSHHLTLEEA